MSRVYSPQTDDEMFDTVSTEKNKPKMSRKLKIIIIVSIISVVIIAAIVAVAVVLANKGGDETTSKPGQNPDDPNINDDPNNPTEPSDPTDPSDPDDPNKPSVPPPEPIAGLGRIILDGNGGTGTSVDNSYAPGEVISTSFTNPYSRDGYSFVCWSTQKNSNTCDVPFPYTFNKEVTLYAVWKENKKTYTIEFNAGGGTFPSGVTIGMDPLIVDEGETVQSIPNPYRRSNYNFKGWRDDSNNEQIVNFPATFTKDTMLIATWELQTDPKTIISFNGNTGTGNMDTIKVDQNSQILEMRNDFTPPKNGYFLGFSKTQPSTRKSLSEPELVTFPLKADSSFTLYAQWGYYTIHKVTLHYNDNVTENLEFDQREDQELQSPEATREGYKFQGWFTTSTFDEGTQVVFPATIKQETQLYAKWQEHTICGTISFDPNDGFGTMAPVSFAEGDTVNSFDNLFRNAGHDFAGWYTSPSCTEAYKVNFPFLFKESLLLYPKWNLNIPTGYCILRYDLNGGVGERIEPTLNEIEGPVISTLVPTTFDGPDGSKFIGWAESKENYFNIYTFYQRYTVSDYKVKNGYITLYAIWAKDVYTAEFDLAGGSADIHPWYIPKNHFDDPNAYSITGPYYTVSKTGYAFVRWQSDEFGVLGKYPIFSKKPSKDVVVYTAMYVLDTDPLGGNSDKYRDSTLWIKGMTPIGPERWENRNEGFKTKAVYWKPSDNWYDVKKRTPSSFGMYDSNMCWAAADSTAIHWWVDRNKEYIDRYFRLPINQNKKRPNTTFKDVLTSDVMEDFHTHWGNVGGDMIQGFNWWINGIEGKPGGGYFADVFKGVYLARRVSDSQPTRRAFNLFVVSAFEAGEPVTITTLQLQAHAETVWGVDIDSDGWIRQIYYVDSNHKDYTTSSGHRVSILKSGILYFDQGTKMPWPKGTSPEDNVNTNPHVYEPSAVEGYANPLFEAQSYDIGTEYWEKYFQIHDPQNLTKIPNNEK